MTTGAKILHHVICSADYVSRAAPSTLLHSCAIFSCPPYHNQYLSTSRSLHLPYCHKLTVAHCRTSHLVPKSSTNIEMAEVATNGTSPAPTGEPVPLDTIPVSPNGAMTDVTNGSDKFEDGEKVVTVFDDPSNFNVKHQLQHTWTLWFTKPPSGKQDWSELLKEVISFDSVEEFWGIYVSITTACTPSLAVANPAFFRTTSHQHQSSRKSPTTISSSKACVQNGKTSRTSTVVAGITPSRTARRVTRPG